MTTFSSISWQDGYLATQLTGTYTVNLPSTSAGDLLLIGTMTSDAAAPSGWIRYNSTSSLIFARNCDGSESGGTAVFNFGSADYDRVTPTPRYHWDAVVVKYTSPFNTPTDRNITEHVTEPTPTTVTGDATHKASATWDYTTPPLLYSGSAPQALNSYFFFYRTQLSSGAATTQTVTSGTSRGTQQYGAGLQVPKYEWLDNLDVRNDAGISTTYKSEAVSNGSNSLLYADGALRIRDYIPAYDVFADTFDAGDQCDTGVFADDNTGATKDSGEPNHAGDAGGASQWLFLTPSSDKTVTIVMDPAGFTGLLAVYTGSAVGALTEVTSDSGDPATVMWDATGGVTYKIAFDGAGGAEGPYTTEITCEAITLLDDGVWAVVLDEIVP